MSKHSSRVQVLTCTLLQPKATSSKTAGKPLHKFYVDYSVPANDNVFDPAAFEKFLHDRIKVDGKPGQLGDSIQLSKEGNKLVLTSNIPFSKRYLKVQFALYTQR